MTPSSKHNCLDKKYSDFSPIYIRKLRLTLFDLQQMRKEEDEQLEHLERGLGRLAERSITIKDELEDQDECVDDLLLCRDFGPNFYGFPPCT